MVRPDWPLLALKLVALTHLCGVALQPALAGQYFSGRAEALAYHATVGESVAWIAIAQALVAAICWLNKSLRPWAVMIFVVVFALDGLQIHMGYAKSLDIHFPLGAGLLAVSFAMTLWLWLPATVRPLGSKI